MIDREPTKTEQILAEMKLESLRLEREADTDFRALATTGAADLRFFGTDRLKRASAVALAADDLGIVQRISLELTRRHIARGGR